MRNDNDRRIVLYTPIERRLPMPNSLQYPLELDRRLLRRWERLRTATSIKGPAIDAHNASLLAAVPVSCALVGTTPPRDPNDDINDDDEDDDEEADDDREPAVIREPDRDE